MAQPQRHDTGKNMHMNQWKLCTTRANLIYPKLFEFFIPKHGLWLYLCFRCSQTATALESNYTRTLNIVAIFMNTRCSNKAIALSLRSIAEVVFTGIFQIPDSRKSLKH